MVEFDKEFPKTWPFGVIKTVQWVSCLALVITLAFIPAFFSGVQFVNFCAWTLFIFALFSWFGHVFGLHLRLFSMGQASACFIPFALLDFFYSVVFFLFFSISSLICIVCIFHSFAYSIKLVFWYFFCTIFCLAATGACAFLAILLYRSAPNGKILGLRSVVIQGDKTALFGPASSSSDGFPANGGYPSGTNPV